MRQQLRLAFRRGNENQPRRRAICAGRGHFHQIIKLRQQSRRDGFVLPRIMCATGEKNALKRGRVEWPCSADFGSADCVMGPPFDYITARTSVTEGM